MIKMDRQKFIRPDRQMVRISREKLIIPEREAATEHLQTKQPEIAEAANKPENSIVLACEIDEVINYALVHNGASVVRDICIKNTSETERNALLLKICRQVRSCIFEIWI